jgi:hypothetical protein
MDTGCGGLESNVFPSGFLSWFFPSCPCYFPFLPFQNRNVYPVLLCVQSMEFILLILQGFIAEFALSIRRDFRFALLSSNRS